MLQFFQRVYSAFFKQSHLHQVFLEFSDFCLLLEIVSVHFLTVLAELTLHHLQFFLLDDEFLCFANLSVREVRFVLSSIFQSVACLLSRHVSVFFNNEWL